VINWGFLFKILNMNKNNKKKFPSLLIVGNKRHGVVVSIKSIFIYIKDYGNNKHLCID
jgi:hypothetical protein